MVERPDYFGQSQVRKFLRVARPCEVWLRMVQQTIEVIDGLFDVTIILFFFKVCIKGFFSFQLLQNSVYRVAFFDKNHTLNEKKVAETSAKT